MNYGLSYVGYPSVLEAYSYASWINYVKDSSSTSGWLFLLGGGAISWASKKQTCITGFTMESEFVALAAGGKEAKWLRNLIHEIPIWPKPIAQISIRCDSAATLAKAYSIEYPNKLKKDVVPRKTRTLTIAEETVVGSKASRLESLKQKKQAVAGEGLSNAYNKHYVDSDTNSDAILYSSCLKENKNETNDADNSDMDFSNDNPDRDDDAAGFSVFIYNKFEETPNSTYLSPTATSSSLDFI
nr:zinc finger, CCHC-type [Tanacetum cinerariifolium]